MYNAIDAIASCFEMTGNLVKHQAMSWLITRYTEVLDAVVQVQTVLKSLIAKRTFLPVELNSLELKQIGEKSGRRPYLNQPSQKLLEMHNNRYKYLKEHETRQTDPSNLGLLAKSPKKREQEEAEFRPDLYDVIPKLLKRQVSKQKTSLEISSKSLSDIPTGLDTFNKRDGHEDKISTLQTQFNEEVCSIFQPIYALGVSAR